MSSRTKRVAIYGGSFNPPHVGHVLAVTWALCLDMDEVLVVPCYQHPFAKELAPFDDRFAMCAAAMGWLPRVVMSRVEAELAGESRTVRTLEHLAKLHPDWSMQLLVGADILADASTWYSFERIVELAPLLVIGRAGVNAPVMDPPWLPDVSSSSVRRALQTNDWGALQRIVPHQVLRYIASRGLYEVKT